MGTKTKLSKRKLLNSLKYIFKNTIEYFGPKLFSIDPISTEFKGLFDITKFSDQDIDKLIEENIRGKNVEELEDELHNLLGGIVIMREDKILIAPNCCGDLSNIYSWEEIKSSTSSEWTKIWIGHPWIFYRKLDGQIEISNYYDEDKPEINFENIKFALSEKQLEEGLKEVRTMQESFQERLSNRLKRKNIKNYIQVAEAMGCSYR